MLRGSAAGITTLFVLRMICRDPEPKTPRENAERCFRVVFAMNCMWVMAWIALASTSPDSSIGVLNFLFGAVPPVIIVMDMRLRQDSLSSAHVKKPESMLHNRERVELVRKLGWMWLPKGIVSELLFFAVVMSQLVAGFFSQPAADRLRVVANAIALFMLFIAWRYLRRANRKTGDLLEAEIDKIDKAQKLFNS
jgi:hypothetical protein